MKKNIFIITICCIIAGMTCSMQANAQARPDSVSVHAGQKPLVELLTDEQKETIKYLTVTGKLLDEDYKYIRESLIVKLKELNLRDADIDTIPEKAFKCDYDKWDFEGLDYIILPKKLKYISDEALIIKASLKGIIITGDFPTFGENVWGIPSENYYINIRQPLYLSKDNTLLKTDGNSIFSKDGNTLYYYTESFSDDPTIGYPNDILKTIAGSAFENEALYIMTIPETVDSIGDRAFANVIVSYLTGAGPYPTITCNAINPPKLGNDVFKGSVFLNSIPGMGCEPVYVPDNSIELYRAAKGWKDLPLIKGLSTNIHEIKSSKIISLSGNGTLYQISASKNIKAIEIYDVKGRLTNEIRINGKEASINKATLAKPYAIAKITFDDKTSETIKLMP